MGNVSGFWFDSYCNVIVEIDCCCWMSLLRGFHGVYIDYSRDRTGEGMEPFSSPPSISNSCHRLHHGSSASQVWDVNERIREWS